MEQNTSSRLVQLNSQSVHENKYTDDILDDCSAEKFEKRRDWLHEALYHTTRLQKVLNDASTFYFGDSIVSLQRSSSDGQDRVQRRLFETDSDENESGNETGHSHSHCKSRNKRKRNVTTETINSDGDESCTEHYSLSESEITSPMDSLDGSIDYRSNSKTKRRRLKYSQHDASLISSEDAYWTRDIIEGLSNISDTVKSRLEFYNFLMKTQCPITSAAQGYFSVLPNEIKMLIFSFLQAKDLGKVGRVCKEWYKLSRVDSLWYQLVLRDCPDAKKPDNKTYKWLYECSSVVFTPKVKSSPGTFVYQHHPQIGHKYTGDWHNDTRHGYGIYVWSDNRRYEGEWNCDKRDGYGRYTYPDGTHYEGQWKDDKRNGIGTYSWPDGRQYTGEWVNHRKNGRGVHIWPDGSRYIGQWQEGSRNGHGVFQWMDGRKYDGEWKSGKIKGFGVFYWPDSDRYVGNWEDGKRWGKGKLICADGAVYEQEWAETKFDKTNKGIPPDAKKRKADDADPQSTDNKKPKPSS